MPYKKTGTNIQTLIEPATGGRTAQSLAGYKINGTMLSAATVTSGYLYSNEKYTPSGYKKAGAQLVFPRIGCRPGRRQLLFSITNNSYSNVTKFINSFPDGEMWVSDNNDTRTGTKISKALSDWNSSEDLPCGMLYSVCCLVGAGGGGGAAGILTGYDNNGGSGGVSFFISRWLRLSVVDGVTVQLGGIGAGAAKGILNAGSAGGESYVAGRVGITGGGGAKGGSNNAPVLAEVTYPWGTTYQNAIQTTQGADTSTKAAVSCSFPAPEGGSVSSLQRWGGTAGSGSGYGGAGDGNPSGLMIWY